MDMPTMLSSLPDELILKIMKACDLKSLIALSKTCQRFNAIKNASDLIWKAQMWRMGSIPDDCPDLTAAIAAQYSTKHYFNDCTTWKRLFMKLYLTSQNWALGRYNLTEIQLQDPDFEIWHIKLDHVKGAILLTNIHGGIRFIDFQGNTLYDLPTTTSQYPHCEFDGTYMAFMKDGNDRNKMEIWKRVSEDSYQFAPYTSLEMPRGASPRCYRMKNHHLLVACPFIYQQTCFCDLAFFNLKNPERLATFSVLGMPQYVDFDDELLYVAVETVELDGADDHQLYNPLLLLFRPLANDFMSLESANTMLVTQWREMRMMSSSDVAIELQNALVSKQVVYHMNQLMNHEYSCTAVHVDVRSRLSQAHIVAVGNHEIWVNAARHNLASLVRKYQVQVNDAKSSSEIAKLRYPAFMDALQCKSFHLLKEMNAYNLAVCNGRCVFAVDGSDPNNALEQVNSLVIGADLSHDDGNVYKVHLSSTMEVRALMMDDTTILANLEGNILMVFDFSGDIENFSLPSYQADQIKLGRQEHKWSP